MLRDALVTMIASKLGDRDDLTSKIISEMQLAQEMRLEQNGRFDPWFLVTERSTITTTIGEERIVFPSDFINEVEENGLWYQEPTTLEWLPVIKGEAKKALYFEGEADTATGAPKKYSTNGDHITLYPTPDKVYSLRMRYVAKDAVLSTNIENNWLKYAADLMLYDVCEALAREDIQNEKQAMGFALARDKAWDRLWVMHESRQHTNRSYTKGGE